MYVHCVQYHPPCMLTTSHAGNAVVACDWLPCLSPTQQQTLFQAFFDKAPAHVALLALQE